jgi:septum site-determining protein MinC
MDKGYIENGFIVDVSNANKTSEIIYELSRILDLPDAQSKKVCLKLGSVDLSETELTSIKALVESMNSEIEFITTSSNVTAKSAQDLNIEVSVLENVVPTPEFDADREKINQELEKALDKIFGDDNSEIKTFGQIEGAKELGSQAAKNEEEQRSGEQEGKQLTVESGKLKVESLSSHTPSPDGEGWDGVISTNNSENSQEQLTDTNLSTFQPFNPSTEYAEFNSELNDANKIEGEELQEIDFNLDDLRKALRETEKLPTLYIQRTLRSGQSIKSEGNIVIIGDVNPGSEVIAQGDITIWGILGGIAHAGSDGNKFAKIRALKMNAIQLRIADVFARRPDSANIPYIQKTDTFVPEEASIKKKQIVISKMHEV